MRRWLQQRIHLSWHVAGFAVGVIAATVGALWLPAYFADIWWLGVAVALFGWAACRQARWLWLAACVAGACVGSWRGVNERLALEVYRPYYGQLVSVSGVLREDVSYGTRGDMRFELSEVRLADSLQLRGRVWVSTAQKLDLKRGDTVQMQGQLAEGFGALPASMHRATILRVERPHPGDLARIFRDWFADGVRQAVPEPQASLGIGYLTGQRSSLPAELDEQLQTVGLTHAVVASGYNLTILVTFARNLLAGISKYLTTVAAGLLIVFFVLITGFSPSMTRAGLVSGLSLLSWYYGRVFHPLVLLPLTAMLTVLWRPSFAWGDLGWCLSFAAFAGVMIVAPLLQQYFWGDRVKPPMLLRLVIETTAAQAATLPIILYSFSQYATYALPANLLVVPLIPLAMVCTFATGAITLAVPGAAHVAGWPTTMLLRYMTEAVERIARLPGATEEVTFNGWLLVASYALLGTLIVWLWRKTNYDFRGSPKTTKKV